DAARPDIVLSYMQALILLGRQGDAVDLIKRTGEGARARDPDLYRLLTARLIQISLFDPELQSVVVELQEARGDAQDFGLGLGADTLAAAWALHGATRGSSRAQALRDATRALASGGLTSGSERFYVIHAAFALTVCGETAAAGNAFDAALA